MDQNSNSPERQSNTTPGREYETNTVALTVLVLATLLVVGITLSMAQPEATRNSQQSADVSKEDKNSFGFRSDGNLSSVLGAFPQTLPAPQPSRVVSVLQKEDSSLNQHIARYETNQSLDELFSEYRSWAQTSNFQIVNSSKDSSSAVLVLENSNSQLFITINNLTDSRRVELNLVKQ